MACNGLFGNGNGSLISPPDPARVFTLRTAEIAIVNEPFRRFLADLRSTLDMSKHLNRNESVTERALFIVNEAINAFTTNGLNMAQSILDDFLGRQGAPERFLVSAAGHCHIDTAWLWRFRETRRKCARSWASQLRLLERFPDYHFVCPQMQQLEWVREDYPELWSEIKARVEEGRFCPVGGSWVEMDGNMPSGESFVRHLLYGQHFQKEHFGSYSSIFWLPDSFGYNGQLPQLMALAGMPYFLTQKISWNNIDRFPHNSFHWEGLDGTRVLAHFPPADTYTSDASVGDLRKSEVKYRDGDRSEQALLLFGYGDGGGGPTGEMLERLDRLANVHGLPKIKQENPKEFFDRLRLESDRFEVWKGELYLEFHRGTLTSQAKIKYYNRKCEGLLREAEIICTVLTTIYPEAEYPKAAIERLWKDVLLCQFHDVLPGSSIEDVYHDASKIYQAVELEASKIRELALRRLFGIPQPQKEENVTGLGEVALFNSIPWERSEVIVVPWDPDPSSPQPGVLAVVGVPGMAMTTLAAHRVREVKAAANVSWSDPNWILENGFVRVLVNAKGQLVSIFDKINSREVLNKDEPANSFWLYDDHPNSWDAWDVEVFYSETGKCVDGDSTVEAGMEGPVLASLVRRTKISPLSTMTQVISLSCLSPHLEFFCSVDWAESHKLLRVLHPVAIASDHGIYECPFGQVSRPTHSNTSWDAAKFEACGHRYVCIEEAGYGVALLNDCKYGHSVQGHTLGMSLLRAPKQPDPTCDMSKHIFRYALLPFTNMDTVVAAGYQFNNPLRWAAAPTSSYDPSWLDIPFISITPLVLDTFKLAEDGSGHVIMRMYESVGGRGQARLQLHPRLALQGDPEVVDLLEDPIVSADDDVLINDGSGWLVRYKPFQIITLRLQLSAL